MISLRNSTGRVTSKKLIFVVSKTPMTSPKEEDFNSFAIIVI